MRAELTINRAVANMSHIVSSQEVCGT